MFPAPPKWGLSPEIQPNACTRITLLSLCYLVGIGTLEIITHTKHADTLAVAIGGSNKVLCV